MRALADEERIRGFMEALAEASGNSGRIYFTGGVSAVLLGLRSTAEGTGACRAERPRPPPPSKDHPLQLPRFPTPPQFTTPASSETATRLIRALDDGLSPSTSSQRELSNPENGQAPLGRPSLAGRRGVLPTVIEQSGREPRSPIHERHRGRKAPGAGDRIPRHVGARHTPASDRTSGLERARRQATTRGDSLAHGQPGVANGGHAPLKHRECRGEYRRALFRIGKYASKLELAPGQRRKLRGSRGVGTGQERDAPGIRPLWRGQRRYFDVRCGESVGSVGK
jgi:hypothetical protein